jgi:TonB-dependent SusC/RagA subfamily outer membrane receptor
MKLIASLLLILISASGMCQTKVQIDGPGKKMNPELQPLYILDGKMLRGDSLEALNPNTIAEINILKDSAAVKKYGERAKNGVIIIQTKQGKANATDVEAVKTASYDYIHAFYQGDTVKMYRSISPAVFKYGYYRSRDSVNYAGEVMSWQQIVDYVRRVASRPPNPNLSKLPQNVEVLDVQNRTAATKVTAWWGTDYLLLGKNDDGRWMILQVLWQSPPKQ